MTAFQPFDAEIDRRLRELPAGVVDHRRQRAALGADAREQRFHLFRLAHVRCDRQHARAMMARELRHAFELFQRAAADDHLRAEPRQ